MEKADGYSGLGFTLQIGLQKYSLNKERVASFTTELKSVCGKIRGFLSFISV